MLRTLALDAVMVLGGVGVLYFGAEWLVRGAARLAASFGISPIVVGLTVVSFGTSAPELVVCVVAALEGRPGLAAGNVLGSNLANIGLILGIAALMAPLPVQARVVKREMPIMIAVTLALYAFAEDRMVGRVDGLVLTAALAAYLVYVLRTTEREGPEVVGEFEDFVEDEEGAGPGASRWRNAGLAMAGCGVLVVGGRLIVEGASDLGLALGVPEVVVGLTVVAVGTSLPELATSVVASIRGEVDIAVGNVIGSNIFNITGVLGLTAIAAPTPVQASMLSRELLAVTIMSALLFPLLRTGWVLRRWEGGVLIASYGVALWMLL